MEYGVPCADTLFDDTAEYNAPAPTKKEIELISSQYGDMGLYETYLLHGKGEQCKVTILHGDTIVDGNCLYLTNSKGIKILCTANKTICKTVKEFSFIGH